MDVELERYFAEAKKLGLGDHETILRRVLHTDAAGTRHARELLRRSTPGAIELFEQLDFAVRVRNPGVHYVQRSTYLGYRRETKAADVVGSRSQVFLSVISSTNNLKVVLPLDYERFSGLEMTEDIAERGHHGVGTLRCNIRTAEELACFIETFDDWISNRQS